MFTIPTLVLKKRKWRPIPLALAVALPASLLVSTCPAQTTVEYTPGQNNTNNYDTSAGLLSLILRQAYNSTQSGQITGTGGIWKTGAGTLYLSNPTNSYSGGTTLYYGDILIDNAAALGTGPVFVRGGTLKGGNANLTFNTSVELAHMNDIFRPWLQTAGALEFGHSAVGSLAVTKGSWATAPSAAFGVGAASGASIGAVTDPGSFLAVGNLYVGVDGGSGMVGVSGGGSILVSTSLHLGLNGGQGSFDLHHGGKLTVYNSIYAYSSASVFNFAGGILEAPSDFATSVNMTLTGASTVSANDIHNLRGIALNGVLSGTGSLTKIGVDTLRLTAANTYSGGTLVNEGTLQVNNTSGSGTGTGPVTIAPAATLSGNFNIDSATTIGGSLLVGDSNFGSDLTLQSTATTYFDLYSATAYDTIDVASTFQLDGRIVLNTRNGYVVFGGTTFRLLDWGSINAAGFNLATDLDLSGVAIAHGVTWDTSAFLTRGELIAVVPEPGTGAFLALGLLGVGLCRLRGRCAAC